MFLSNAALLSNNLLFQPARPVAPFTRQNIHFVTIILLVEMLKKSLWNRPEKKSTGSLLPPRFCVLSKDSTWKPHSVRLYCAAVCLLKKRFTKDFRHKINRFLLNSTPAIHLALNAFMFPSKSDV